MQRPVTLLLLGSLLATGTPLVAQDEGADATPAPVAPVPPLPEFTPDDAEAYGLQLATYADAHDSGWKDSYAVSQMTLFDASGDTTIRSSLQLIREGEDGDKSIIRFRTPAEIKGVAAMTHENPDAVDDSWLYLPSSKRVRRISGANRTASFQGTEFTYEDLSNLIVRKYDWRFLEETTAETDGEAQPTYALEARPNYADTGYSRLVVHYNRENWRRERVEYHDKAGRLLKVLSGGRWEHVHDRFWRPMTITMENVQTGKKTVIEVQSMLVDLSRYKSARTGEPRPNLPESLFTTRALSRG